MDAINQENNKKEEQQKKLPLFSTAKISKYYLIPFITPIFCISSNFVISKYVEYNRNFDEIKFYISKILFIDQILGGCFYFIFIKNNLNENHDQRKSSKISRSSNSSLIFNDVEKDKFMKALKIIGILSIFTLLHQELTILTMRDTIFDIRLFLLVFIAFLSYIISGKKIFLHQTISLLFSISGLIIVCLSIILYSPNGSVKLSSNIFVILSGFLYALQIFGFKYVMEELFVSPYLLLFITGLIAFFLDFIFNIFYNLITGENLGNIFTNITFLINQENMKVCIITLIFLVILGTAYFIFVMSTLSYFSPTLLVVSDLLSPLITNIIINLSGPEFNGKKFLLSSIGYLISLIAAIFYNELIVCNFLGLNENTSDNIRKRGQEEQRKTLLNDTNTEDGSNNSDGEEENEGN